MGPDIHTVLTAARFGPAICHIAHLQQQIAQQQIQFINKIIQYVENEGVMDVGDLLKSPFDKPVSFTRMFDTRTMTELIDTIKSINSNASTASES